MVDAAKTERIGFLLDGDPKTDLMTAAYEFDRSSVRLRVPFRAHIDERGRWWTGDTVHYADDPDRTRFAYAPPSEMTYYDNVGPVGLVGCRSGGFSMSFTTPAGVGTVLARYAIEGAQFADHYVRIHGLRSEIDGLAFWFNVSAHTTQMRHPKSGKPLEISTTMTAVDDLPLSRRLNLRVVTFGSGPGMWSPEVTYHTRAHLQTNTATRRDWEEHLELHEAVRNLLRVASWRPVNFTSHQVMSSEGRRPSASNGLPFPWHEVRTTATGISDPAWSQQDRSLFNFADIEATGVRKWITLAKRYQRGIQPFVGLLDLEGVTIDAALSQLGIAVEAFGYQALIDSGKSPAAADRSKLAQRVEHLIGYAGDSLSFAHTNFGRDFADSYNSVKHANRPLVTPGLKLEHFHQGVELLRVWIALNLGVPAATLESRR